MAKTVVIVKDDEALGSILVKKFRDAGYDPLWITDGEAGLATIKTAQPDAILIDVNLPKIDGLAVLQALRASNELQSIPVVVLSNEFQDLHLAQFEKLGVKEHLIAAHVLPTDIVAAVEKYL
jgi:DNA-binding response OmpR family regulator